MTKQCFLLTLFALTGFISSHAAPVNAQTVFSDNFDDGDISNWTVVRNARLYEKTEPCMNGGVPAAWHVKNGRAGIEIDSPPCETEIVPSNFQLGDKGYTYEVDWFMAETMEMDRNLLFLWQDPKNWYDIKIYGNSVLIQKVINGQSMELENDYMPYPFEANKSYHFKITMSENHLITVEINGKVLMTSRDYAPYIEGYRTAGLQASVGANRRSVNYFDNWQVTNHGVTPTPSPTPVPISMPHFKQTDPNWASQIYDHATKWSSNPTISRWGCALSSAAMILRYHGINQLPGGIELNPRTLNTWLQTQPDGYIGEGLVNWVALGRLTQQMSSVLGTPKLEYTRINTNLIAAAVSELEALKPVILQIPGHFLVGSGVTSDKQDLQIKDPAYAHTLLSQHSQPLQSVRAFQPSHTDLSYISW
jgi:hypothetical protein